MDKTLTLEPICITDGSSFGKILKSSDRKANLTINARTSIYVGLVGFEYDSLHARSTACKFKKLHVDFSQSGGDLGWTNWELTPYEVSNFEIKDGTRLTSHTDRIICLTKKTGSHDLDEWYPQSYDFDNGNAPLDLFGSNMLALGLVASNDAYVASQKLWMKELKLTLTYTARYYAQFYNDGAHVETKTVNGGESATPPSVSKTGYRLVGWKRGNTTYSANELPTSEYTDLRFDAVWERIYYKVTLPKTKTGSCRVTNVDGSFTYAKSKDTDTTEKVTVAHGDLIKVYASGFGTRSQNLLVKINNGAETEINGVGVNNIEIFSGTVTAAMTFAIRAKTITFPLTITLKNSGGEVNAPSSITRFANAKITVQSYIGYCLDYVKLDGVRYQPIGETESWQQLLQNVNEPHTLEVAFKPIQVPIAFNVGEHITVTDENGTDVTSGATVDYGGEKTFTFHVSSDYSLDTVMLGNETLLSVFKKTQTFKCSISGVTVAQAFIATETNDLVNITLQQNTGGTVSGESGYFVRGRGTLGFRAFAQENYVLTRWFNDDTEYTTTLAITSDLSDTVVCAEFVQPEYEVSCLVRTNLNPGHLDPWTEVFPDSEGRSHNYYVNSGDSVSVPYFLNEGGVLREVAVNVDGVLRYLSPSNPEETILGCKLTLTDHSVEVENVQSFVDLGFYFTFGTFKYTFTASPEEKGTFKLSYASGQVVIEGDEITLGYYTLFSAKAIPVKGWHFAYWSDDKNIASNPRDFRIKGQDTEVTAVFQKDKKQIDVEAQESGAVTPSGVVEYGDDFLLKITADVGQKIKDVILDGVSIYDDVTLTRRGGRYLLENITEPHSFRVIFTPKTYTNNRKLFDYWPPVIQRIRDMQEIARVQQPMIDELWDAVSWLMENQCIDTATEEAVVLWEKELGIVPAPSDTLRQRKARLKLKWVPHNRFTLPWLYDWLRSATGRDDIQYPTVPENTYGLLVRLPWDADWRTIFSDLQRYKPCNIWLDPHVDTPSSNMRVLAGFATGLHQKRTHKNENQADRYECVFDEQEGHYVYRYKESEAGQ